MLKIDKGNWNGEFTLLFQGVKKTCKLIMPTLLRMTSAIFSCNKEKNKAKIKSKVASLLLQILMAVTFDHSKIYIKIYIKTVQENGHLF